MKKGKFGAFNKWVDSISQRPLTLVVWIVIIIAIIWGGSKLWKYIADWLDAKKRMSDYDYNNAIATLSDSAALTMADQLFNAMNIWGTDEDAIYAVLNKLQNKDDWNKIVSKFGIRKSTMWGSSFTGDLIVWLSDELNSKEKAIVRGILAKISVTIF
jgi:hypothetical protein